MKLIIVHQNQENRVGAGGEEQTVKTEAEEVEQAEESPIRVPPASEGFLALEAPPVPDNNPMLVSGKRKRKPKEMIDEVSPIYRRKKKKSSSLKPKEEADSLCFRKKLSGIVSVINGRWGKMFKLKSCRNAIFHKFVMAIRLDLVCYLSFLSCNGQCFWGFGLHFANTTSATMVNDHKKLIKYSIQPVYKLLEQGSPDSGGTQISKGDTTVGGSSNPAQVKSPTLIRAEEVQMSLSKDHPSFLKVLVRSHVASCFWMGLPVPFCKIHLPSKDTQVVLENENGEEFSIKYIAHKTGLSAGWRKFVAGNKLIEGDVLIFQLIEPCRLKVYVIRANDLTEVDGALSLLILDSKIKQDAEENMDAQTKKKRPKSLPLTVVQKKKDTEFPSLRPHIVGFPEEHSGNNSEEVASEVLEGTKSNISSIQFNDIKGFEDFRIMVNGVCLDPELPEHIRRAYYDLCCSKNAYLHDRVLPGLYSKLAAGMIVETISIADFIRGCKLTTPRKDFEVGEKSLRSFELLGLNVGFLRARLRRLLSLAHDSEGGMDVRRYFEAQKEKSELEDEIWKLETKLVELKELYGKCACDVENLQAKAESYQAKFQEEVDAPW
ncbi:B3 domain-containing protein [Striga asiatica]|uniref:B3 domain-containing protein n=1 Tax=Striga asiatica TaxID=4170 RepID=A0A5A7PF18_STRAF|nr:B3 domain-containing protein [Striga asiatica]